MSSASSSSAVGLEPGATASSLLHRLLQDAVARFPELSTAGLAEDAHAFKRDFPEQLVAFEAARVASPRRTGIAAAISDGAQSQLTFGGNGALRPLVSALGERAEPLPLQRIDGHGAPNLEPGVPLDGVVHRGQELEALLEQWEQFHWLTKAAANGIRWIMNEAVDDAGVLDLRGRKVVMMGAGAELAPTPLLLAGGAEVLWLDITAPSERLAADPWAGTLSYCPDGADLLQQPDRTAATIRAFAGSDPVDVGMFAYAPGKSREWRLEATMNAIARTLPQGMVRSAAMYVSPTSAHVVQPEDVREAEARDQSRPGWQRAFRAMGVLRPSHHRHEGVTVARSIVPLQGTSYQATQYVSKILAGEAMAFAGDGNRRLRVSPNVAGITNTSSMSEPMFQAGFVGAPAFGVQILEPATTRWLNGLLLLHDLLHETTARDPGELFARQVHGGIHAMPDALDGAIKVAAVMGLAKRPKLAAQMLRR